MASPPLRSWLLVLLAPRPVSSKFRQLRTPPTSRTGVRASSPMLSRRVLFFVAKVSFDMHNVMQWMA